MRTSCCVAPTARSRPSSRRRSVTCMKKLCAMLIALIAMMIERDQDQHEPDHEHHGRELLAERVLEPEVELVLQPLRERRELVLSLERDDDRRVGRRRFLADGTRGSSARCTGSASSCRSASPCR